MHQVKRRIGQWLIVPLIAITLAGAQSKERSRIARLLEMGARPSDDQAYEGRKLFLQQFASEPQEEGGDGLGPLFNHVSCAACHHQGTTGGGGGVEFNVALLCAQLDGAGSRPNKKLL